MIPEPMLTDVHFQLQLVCLDRLADSTLVLHLVVRFQVTFHGCRAVCGVNAEWTLSLLEPTGRDCVAFLVFYQLLWRLHELMTHITLIHSCDQVNLQVSFKHSFCFADKIAENTFKSFVWLFFTADTGLGIRPY